MAESIAAISLGASILTFIDLTGKVLERLQDFYNSRDVPEAFRDIADRLRLLVDKVKEIKDIYEDGTIDKEKASPLTRALDGCQRQITKLDTIMSKCLPARGDGLSKGNSRFSLTVKAFRSLYKEKDVVKIRQMLHEYESTLTFYFSDCSMRASAKSDVQAPDTRRFYEVPGLAAPRFIERKALTESIQEGFAASNSNDSRSPVVVLQGIGGQGKTQLALEYCRSLRSTHSVFWFDVSSSASALQSFNQVALSLSSQKLPFAENPVKYVLRSLEDLGHPYLAVFDNFDSPREFPDMTALIPQSLDGRVLFTSRHMESSRLGRLIKVPPMSTEEGVELLLLRSRQAFDVQNMTIAGKIIEQLGGLALAIDQAGSYMSSRGLPVEDFLVHFLERREHILNYVPCVWSYARQLSVDENRTNLSVFTTWELSFTEYGDTAEEREPYIHFLTLAAHLDTLSISQLVFQSSQEHASALLPSFGTLFTTDGRWDAYKYQDMVISLLSVSLIQSVELKGSNTCFSLHPLVAEWLRLRLEASQRQQYLDEVITMLKCITDNYNSREEGLSFANIEETAAHVRACGFHDHRLASKDGLDCVSNCFTDAAESFASFLRYSDKFDEAEIILHRALRSTRMHSVHEKLQSTALRSTIMRSEFEKLQLGLGELYLRKRKLVEAQAIFQEALDRRKALHGAKSFKTLRAMNFLAKTLVAQGQNMAAKKLYEDALIDEDIYERNESLLLETIHGLAHILITLHRYEEAERLTVRVLRAYESAFGRRHIRSLVVLNDLANVYCGQENLSAANSTYREVLSAYEIIYGPTHTTTLTVVFNISLLSRKLKNLHEARELGIRAFNGRERVLALEHPRTLEAAASLIVTCIAADYGSSALAILSRCLCHVYDGTPEQRGRFADLACRLAAHLSKRGSVVLAKTIVSNELHSLLSKDPDDEALQKRIALFEDQVFRVQEKYYPPADASLTVQPPCKYETKAGNWTPSGSDTPSPFQGIAISNLPVVRTFNEHLPTTILPKSPDYSRRSVLSIQNVSLAYTIGSFDPRKCRQSSPHPRADEAADVAELETLRNLDQRKLIQTKPPPASAMLAMSEMKPITRIHSPYKCEYCHRGYISANGLSHHLSQREFDLYLKTHHPLEDLPLWND